ncbi:MAG TPA: hypothetical protein VMV96_01080 [Acidimicrobiales bacterium]|nr:hypothetical protein [Acidimicrobiales bacterium]
MSNDVILIPLKRFDIAKERLRRAGAPDVTTIARELAMGVIAACHPRRVVVVSESAEVSRFAREHGAEAFESNASDLNSAVTFAYQSFGATCNRLFIVHGDLREPRGLGDFEPVEGITIVTDRHGTGTNVLVLPAHLDFHFGYGPRSAQRHELEAQRLRVATHVVTDSPWGHDVDEIKDLD